MKDWNCDSVAEDFAEETVLLPYRLFRRAAAAGIISFWQATWFVSKRERPKEAQSQLIFERDCLWRSPFCVEWGSVG